MHRGNVGMVELGERQSFFVEALADVRVGERKRRQNFNRDVALQARIVRAIDAPHAAGANLFQQPVMTERASDHGSAPPARSVILGWQKYRVNARTKSAFRITGSRVFSAAGLKGQARR